MDKLQWTSDLLWNKVNLKALHKVHNVGNIVDINNEIIWKPGSNDANKSWHWEFFNALRVA